MADPAITLDRPEFAALVDAVAQAVADRLAAPAAQTFDQPGAIAYSGLPRSTWFRLRSAGKLPAPVEVEGTGPRWRRSDLDKWLERLKPRRTRSTAKT